MLGCLGNHDIGGGERVCVCVCVCVCVLVGNPLPPPPCASSGGAECWPCLHSHHPSCTWNDFAVMWSDCGLPVIGHFLWVSSFDGGRCLEVCPKASRMWLKAPSPPPSPLQLSWCGLWLSYQSWLLQPWGDFSSWKIWSVLPGCDSHPVLWQPGGHEWAWVTRDHRGCLLHHTSPSGKGRVDCPLGPKLAFSVSKSKEQLLSSLVCFGMLAAAEEQLPQQPVRLDPFFEAEFAVRTARSGDIIWQPVLSRRNASAKRFCILGRPLDSANPLILTILCGDHFMWF